MNLLKYDPQNQSILVVAKSVVYTAGFVWMLIKESVSKQAPLRKRGLSFLKI